MKKEEKKTKITIRIIIKEKIKHSFYALIFTYLRISNSTPVKRKDTGQNTKATLTRTNRNTRLTLSRRDWFYQICIRKVIEERISHARVVILRTRGRVIQFHA